MKRKSVLKKLAAMSMIGALSAASLAGCGAKGGDNAGAMTESAGAEKAEEEDETASAADGGTIMFLANTASGAQYDFYVAYLNEICGNLGYEVKVVYGDQSNDPNGNLTAVKNDMTSDVVGLITMQDGGIDAIMAEYPDLYVAGFLTNMDSVYSEGGASASCATNDHFLGTVAEGIVDCQTYADVYFDVIKEKGYKKISTMQFPAFAYPALAGTVEALRADVEEYNQTASADEKIEIVGDTQELMFAPLDASYFMETENQDLDCIVSVCDGVNFVYPELLSAKGDGSASADTQLLTGGFSNDPSILADIGENGTIGGVIICSVESLVYPVVMLDNALNGNMYSDYAQSECVDAALYVIDSEEEVTAMQENSAFLTLDMNKLALSWDDIQQYLTRYNADASYADLMELIGSEQLTEEAFLN